MGYYLRNPVELSDAEVPDLAEEVMVGSVGLHEPREDEESESDDESEDEQESQSENDQEFIYEPNWNAVMLEDMMEVGYSVHVPLLGPDTPVGLGDLFGAGVVPRRCRILESPDDRLAGECYLLNFVEIARHLLSAVGAVGSDQAVAEMSTALAFAVNGRSLLSLTACPGRGPLVVGCVADRIAGVVIGYGVGQLNPQPVVEENGDFTGLEWYPEVRGFSINDDDDCRRIVSEFIADAVFRMDGQNIQ